MSDLNPKFADKWPIVEGRVADFNRLNKNEKVVKIIIFVYDIVAIGDGEFPIEN